MMGRSLSGRFERLEFTRANRILVITLNRLEAHNAIDAQMHDELLTALTDADRDPDVRCIIITGAGATFSVGGDIPGMAGSSGTNLRQRAGAVRNPGRELIDGILAVEKPTVAMINGIVAGVAATVALFCDLSFMDEAALIRDHHVPLGLVAGDGGAVIWPLHIGNNRARRLLMSGEPITGTQAEAVGLVNRAVPASQLRPLTFEVATRLASARPYAVRATKALLQQYAIRATERTFDTAVGWEITTLTSREHHRRVEQWMLGWPDNLSYRSPQPPNSESGQLNE